MTPEPVYDGWRVLELAVEMAKRGEDFALATVVWREGPSSGQHGSRAIVTTSGEILGWIGGACAEPVLIREALRSLDEGTPRLLALGQSNELDEERSGVTSIAIACQSDGALQIFIEPVVPAPHLLIIGRSPMAHTLSQLAGDLGWNVELVDGSDFSVDGVTGRSLVVVATQGHGDEDIIERVLAARPLYVGAVGSARRGEALRGYLADRGAPDEILDTLNIPVGLDLGRTSHREMAVAVLAELVERKASGEFRQRLAGAAQDSLTSAIDPICGMSVSPVATSLHLDRGSETFYFCGVGCRDQFVSDHPLAAPQTHRAGGATC